MKRSMFSYVAEGVNKEVEVEAVDKGAEFAKPVHLQPHRHDQKSKIKANMTRTGQANSHRQLLEVRHLQHVGGQEDPLHHLHLARLHPPGVDVAQHLHSVLWNPQALLRPNSPAETLQVQFPVS